MTLLECKLCDYKAKQLHQHLKSRHKMTTIEYRHKFGMAEVMQFGFIPPAQVSLFSEESKRTKKAYQKQESNLSKLTVYNLKSTQRILLTNMMWKRYLGKAKYRTLINDNAKLYKSILFHTKVLFDYSISSTLENKMIFIIEHNCNMESIKCKCGKKYTFANGCRECSHNKVRNLTNEYKQKIRVAIINDISTKTGSCRPNYNKLSIPIIESYGKRNNYNFQHAENGGEYHIKELGYFLDAYDKKANVALEIDEKHHFKNGKLRSQDVQRQKEIEAYLGCKFKRIKYVS
jgi:hypothetical protein